MKRLRNLIIVFIALFCGMGCAKDKEISEEQILYQLEWEGKEITFFESSTLSYTDGEKTYGPGYHMLNSEDGTKRLYVIEDAFGIEYQIIQDDEILKPIDTFVVKNYEGEMYENAMALLQDLGIVNENMILTNVVAKVYSLDTSKSARLWLEGMRDSIARRWEEIAKNHFRGDAVHASYEELTDMINSWTKVNVAKNRIASNTRKYLVSWEGIADNQLLFNNGMARHIPTIKVNLVSIDEKQYIEVENLMNYSEASIDYYELNEAQLHELMNWRENLQAIIS